MNILFYFILFYFVLFCFVIDRRYETGVISEIQRHKLLFLETKDVVATTLALHNFRQAMDMNM